LQNDVSRSLLSSLPSSLSTGTPVWTSTGRRPIEQIQVGDLVLSQHPISGELAYKPVFEVFRATLPTRRVDVEGEEFRCASGQAFWTVDKGWWLASDASVDSRLYTLAGPQRVVRNAQLIAGETRQLVVADFSNFFVGQLGVLVHDAKQPEAVAMRVPGLPAEARE